MEVVIVVIQEKPDATKWKSKQVHNYDKLEELFAKDRATGFGAETTKEAHNRWANEQPEVELGSFIDVERLLSQNDITLECFDNVTKVSKDSNKRSSQGKSNIHTKKRKTAVTDEELQIMKGALDNVASAIREGNVIFQNSRERVYSEAEIYDELIEIGIDSDNIDDCYLFLTQNQAKSRAFFGCPRERRKRILGKMMDARN